MAFVCPSVAVCPSAVGSQAVAGLYTRLGEPRVAHLREGASELVDVLACYFPLRFTPPQDRFETLGAGNRASEAPCLRALFTRRTRRKSPGYLRVQCRKMVAPSERPDRTPANAARDAQRSVTAFPCWLVVVGGSSVPLCQLPQWPGLV
jgi:hypothetical protein